MLSITGAEELARALGSPIDPVLRRLLALRCHQLLEFDGYQLGQLVHFIVAEPGDTVAHIEAEAGIPIISSPAFEWVGQHDEWYEAPTIVSDEGFGIVLFVPVREDIDPHILSAVRKHVLAADSNGNSPNQGGRLQPDQI